MNVLYANILFILTRYFTFLNNFFRKPFIRSIIYSLSYFLYAYAFYVLGCYSATIIFLIYGLNKYSLINKYSNKLLSKLLITIVLLYIVYFYEGISIYNINLLPYLIYFIEIWIINYIKKSKLKTTISFLNDLLWMIYSYIVKAYVFFIYKVSKWVFNIFGNGLKKMIYELSKKTR